MNKPRPECDDPCNAWTGKVCGHAVLCGKGACVLDDPARRAQRNERMRKKAMEVRK